MRDWLDRRFQLRAQGTTVRTEIVAGTTTFFTLSYILFVQPAVMKIAGVDPGTALFATCVGSAIACALMAFLANYPIALAPAMGHNFYFALVACGALGLTWQQGLAGVFVAGSLFVLLSAVRFREHVLRALPADLQHAIAAGIGLLIGMIGLQWGGIVVDHPATLVTLGDLAAKPALLALAGLAIIGILVALRVRAALFLGLAATVAIGMASGMVRRPESLCSTDFVRAPVLFDLDFRGLLTAPHAVEVVLVFFFLALFDTVGTLIGVGARAGLLVNGELPRAGRALLADACGTVAGAALGTSTITSYVESAAGVQAGGRTGLTSLVAGAWLLLALPLHPLIAVVGEGTPAAGGATLYPVLAPVLIAVGALMAKSAAAIDWDDVTVALPCFLCALVIPLTFSITEGIAFGAIGCSLLSLVARRRRPPLLHALALAFVLRYALLS